MGKILGMLCQNLDFFEKNTCLKNQLGDSFVVVASIMGVKVDFQEYVQVMPLYQERGLTTSGASGPAGEPIY